MKTILVTGGNRGIGLEICRQLAEQGHKVIMGSRDLVKGQKEAASLKGSIHVLQLDVTNETDITNAAETIKKQLGSLDVLINNAGIVSTTTGPSEVDMQEVKTVMETNFFGAWQLTQVLTPLLKKSKDGRIVNMSSGMGALDSLVGDYAAYRLSKTALNGLTIELANELAGSIKVNAMCPGWVRTDMGGAGASRSVEEGADTAVWLATTDDIPSGKFFRDTEVIDW